MLPAYHCPRGCPKIRTKRIQRNHLDGVRHTFNIPNRKVERRSENEFKARHTTTTGRASICQQFNGSVQIAQRGVCGLNIFGCGE